MKEKFKSVVDWLKIVLIFLLVVSGCGFSSYFVWQAMGTTIQQIILGTLAVGVVWNCIVPFIALIALILVILCAVFIVDWLQSL
ncbi:MAG: hypothetical protein UW41_C0027G0011 [Candidatus Collierbacteria bacterium GW2011_GWC2_44_18]|uniref:Uncharacterized protein n=2 Tax=Microgenomates group TaxID=1794810 RepID=A0A0G1LCE3_9BACT|nr:MAG: hypothetical protein UW16_C0025G0018 [Microgenomates group bacterium GW2011_GWC1_44_10]KKT48498.1 MAG: hypothetical protein UW41_C0027G0011 [Candidatus Collierbacteria bacterium GW2011_GWC2_44_18]KKT66362.1 MAG: hypothetical protein UW60_C0025G0022 [Candidatus Woesebacteria bacterium GW2011_GWA2_44_33]